MEAAAQQHAITEAVGDTTHTVERDWVKARGWLHQELTGDTR